MRFLFIKNEQLCRHCGSVLFYGEEAVVIRIRHSNGAVIPLFFHTDKCYELWNSETFTSRLLRWRLTATERPEQKRKKKKTKLGRPKKYTNGVLARRLIALLWYHKKAGNIDRVGEIEIRIKELEI